MKTNGVFLAVALCLLALTLVPVHGATYSVQCDPGGFYPANITINEGDTIEFYNYTGFSLLTVYHVSGPCSSWIIDIPNNGYTPITFNCGPGTESYADSTFGFTGTITINPPPEPTPTPNPDLPATTTTGVFIALTLISLLMVVPTFRK
ncbi:hypothetical protein JXA80_14560 [bacterium]|nr:hypothetical protein [candidate division CSSED10-310 bacterium]